jgi:hypothetical protein
MDGQRTNESLCCGFFDCGERSRNNHEKNWLRARFHIPITFFSNTVLMGAFNHSFHLSSFMTVNELKTNRSRHIEDPFREVQNND